MSCSAELSMNSYYLGARLRICAVSFVSLFNPFQAGNSFKKQVQTLQTQLRHSNVFLFLCKTLFAYRNFYAKSNKNSNAFNSGIH